MILLELLWGWRKTGKGKRRFGFIEKESWINWPSIVFGDVRLTRDLYDYLKEFGKVAYFDVRGEKKEMDVDLGKWFPTQP